MPVRVRKASRTLVAPVCDKKLRHAAVEQHDALVKHDDLIRSHNFIHQMRCPEHAEASLATRSRTILMTLSREPRSRPTVGFVEQQQVGAMHHRASDFDASQLTARKRANLLVAAIGEADEFERLTGPLVASLLEKPCSAA